MHCNYLNTYWQSRSCHDLDSHYLESPDTRGQQSSSRWQPALTKFNFICSSLYSKGTEMLAEMRWFVLEAYLHTCFFNTCAVVTEWLPFAVHVASSICTWLPISYLFYFSHSIAVKNWVTYLQISTCTTLSCLVTLHNKQTLYALIVLTSTCVLYTPNSRNMTADTINWRPWFNVNMRGDRSKLLQIRKVFPLSMDFSASHCCYLILLLLQYSFSRRSSSHLPS